MELEEFLEQWKKSRDKSTRIPTGANIQEHKRRADYEFSQELAQRFSLFTREATARALNNYATKDNHVDFRKDLSKERCRRLGIIFPDIRRITADEIDRVYLTPKATEKFAEFFLQKGVIRPYKKEDLLKKLARAVSEYFI